MPGELVYSEKLKDPRWQKKRLEIFERDEWKCKDCGSKTNTLHIHHLFYFKDLEPWDVPSGFLITLCESCHSLQKKYSKGNDPDLDWIIFDIGKLLDEFWNKKYSVRDLSLLQEAIFHLKTIPNGSLIRFYLKAEYFDDFVDSEPQK